MIEVCNFLSPDCFTSGRGGADVLALVLHDTCGPTDYNDPAEDPAMATRFGQGAANYLLSNVRQVSAHYLIGPEASGEGEMAEIWHICHESDTAYHCGGNPPSYPSMWTDPDLKQNYGGWRLNQRTIGIERYGQANDVVGPRQLAAIRYLLCGYAGPGGDQGAGILGRHPQLKDPRRIVSHKMVEPGDRWDGANWLTLAQNIAAGK